MFQHSRVQESAKTCPEPLPRQSKERRSGNNSRPRLCSQSLGAPTSRLTLTFTSHLQGLMQPPDQPGQGHDAFIPCLFLPLIPWTRPDRTVETPCPLLHEECPTPSRDWGASEPRQTDLSHRRMQRDQKMARPYLPPAYDIPKHTDLRGENAQLLFCLGSEEAQQVIVA